MSEAKPAPRLARQEALNSIADSLSALATRLQGRAAASADFARLTERARHIAAKAWDVRTSRWGFTENAERLADDLLAFAQEAAAASSRARSETECNMAIVEALVAQAGRIARLGQQAVVGHDEMRTALEPLEATLLTMQAGVVIEGSVIADAIALAGQAAAISDYALGLRGGVREAEEAAGAIAKAMNVFIDEATLISNRMSNASIGFTDAVTSMASGTRAVRRRYVDRVTGVVWS
jgi:hypothetical protein